MIEQMIRLTIDGQETRCPAGSTVYEAAIAAGIHIPIFCHHPKLVPVAACRTCLVEVEGMYGLQTSCNLPAREGMVVRVRTSPSAVKARWAMIEFLLTNHPLDCPVCDKGGECPLQDQAMTDGPGQSRYVEPKRHKHKRCPLGELIVLDQERCVLCWRCIRFLDEWADHHELDLFGRGAETRLETFPGRPLTSYWQGNTIDVCPVGALTSRVFRFEARVWELQDTPSVCPLCAVGCNTVLGVKNNELRRIVPRENMQVNDAWICDRGRFAHGFVDHPERLTTPLIRRGGELRAATWDEALRLVAERLEQVAQEHGPQAIAGLGSTRATVEANYLFQRFMRGVIGSHNVDHLGRMPAGAARLTSLPALERKDTFLLLGVDPSTEAPLVELWIKKAVLRHGARVIAAHPRQVELAGYGGPWLSYRPGTEAILLNGLARCVLEAGGGRQGRVANLEELRGWVKGYTPEEVERRTGVRAEELVEAARALVAGRRPIVLYGPQWVREGPGGVANLALLLGDVEAAFVPEDNNTLGALEMGVVPHLFPGQQPVSDGKVRSRLAGTWAGKLSPVPGLDFDGMMAAAQAGTLQAMWVMGVDPAADCRVAGQALGSIPFLVVQDLFLTETASLAEVVLPAASFAETDGTFLNLTGRFQAIHAGRRPPGEARPDWWIVTELARRMVGKKRQHAWEFAGAGEVLSEIARVVPGARGLGSEALPAEGWQLGAPPPARRGFVHVEPDEPKADPDYPLVLAAGRLFYDRGTLQRRSDRIQRLVPEAFVMIHPDDAGRLGLADGDRVSVVSAVGRLRFRLRVSDEVAVGVAWAPHNLSAAPLAVLFADRSEPPRVRIVK